MSTRAKMKAKAFEKFLVRKLLVLEGNLVQWAEVDAALGEEMMLRYGEAVAIKAGEQDQAVEYHNRRIAALEKALQALRTCPACGPEPATEETVP